MEFTKTPYVWANAGRNEVIGGTLHFDGGLNNGGSLALSFGTSHVFGDVTNSATGVMAVAGNSQTTFYDDVANGGVLNVMTGSTVVFFGTLTGSGNIGGGVAFDQFVGHLLGIAAKSERHRLRPLRGLNFADE